MSNIKLKNTYDWLNGHGIFTALASKDVPWKSTITAQSIEDDYIGNFSGDKVVSPLVEKLLDDDNELTDTALNRLATTLYNKYGDGWQRAWDALQEEYDPLHNYDGVETYSETESVEGTNTGTQGVSGTNTGTVVVANDDSESVSGTNTGTQSDSGSTHNTGTQTNAGTNTGTQRTDDGLYGFNSASASNDKTSTRTDNLQASGTRTDNLTESTSNTRTDNLAHSETTTRDNEETTTNNLAHSETRTDNLAHDETREREYTITKGGNLGVTTSQQMLESELLFRVKYNFFDTVVYPNIDKVLTMCYYTDEKLY